MSSRFVLGSLYGIAGAVLFLVLASVFLLAVGRPPFVTLLTMVEYAFGDNYSISESLVKATPILLCAFAVILPARLGLITVGGEGQLYLGALLGTAVVVSCPERADIRVAAGYACFGCRRRRDLGRAGGSFARPLRRQ